MFTLLDEGRCVILLDGLDEVSIHTNPRDVAEQIRGFINYYDENKFVITSRVPSYRSIGEALGSKLITFHIRPMDEEVKSDFLETWSKIIELNSSDVSDAEAERAAQSLKQTILNAAKLSVPIARFSTNPSLLRLVIILQRENESLPLLRIDIFNKVTEKLINEWPAKRQTQLVVGRNQVENLLSHIGFWMREHSSASGGLIDIHNLRILMREFHGLDHVSSDELEMSIENFLQTVRNQLGIFVERGSPPVYGFMHLSFAEYYAARYLNNDVNALVTRIKKRLHQPRWYETNLMAVSMFGRLHPENIDKLFEDIIEAETPYEDVLFRNLIFVANCIVEGGYVSQNSIQKIVRKLLDIYCDKNGKGKYKILRNQILDLIKQIYTFADRYAVINELVEALQRFSKEDSALEATLEVVEVVIGLSPLVDTQLGFDKLAEALRQCTSLQSYFKLDKLTYEVHKHGDLLDNIAGWHKHSSTNLARLIGTIFAFDSDYELVEALTSAMFLSPASSCSTTWLLNAGVNFRFLFM